MCSQKRSPKVFAILSIFAAIELASQVSQAQAPYCHKLSLPAIASPSINSSQWMSARSIHIVERNGRQNSSDPNTFTTNRGWESYQWSLVKRNYDQNGKITFLRWAQPLFAALGKNDVILDVGCGDAFLSDIFFEKLSLGPYSDRSAEELPSYVGITYALNQRTLDFFDDRIASGKMRLKTGSFFEEVDVKSLIKPGQKVKLLTDYYGVMSYTERPDLLIKRYLELLSEDGFIAILGQTRIKVAGNKKIFDLLTYLKSIQGIEIQQATENDGAILIRKNGQKIQIPELRMSSPPRDVGNLPLLRTFRLTGNIFDIIKNAESEP